MFVKLFIVIHVYNFKNENWNKKKDHSSKSFVTIKIEVNCLLAEWFNTSVVKVNYL